MRTHALISASAALCGLLLQAGCQTATPQPSAPAKLPRPAVQLYVRPAQPPASSEATVAAVGRPVGQIVAAAQEAKARCEFFAPDSTRLEKMPEGKPGSLSVHRPEGGGQDNYAFDAQGVVTRHQRSDGENYDAGVWVDAP